MMAVSQDLYVTWYHVGQMSLNNDTLAVKTSPSTRSIIAMLDLMTQQFLSKLPLVFTIIGLIGFIGNAFTFLQPALRFNTCCIYSMCGSLADIINLFVNLFPNYLNHSSGNLVISISAGIQCKFKLFAFVFLPQLSMNFLIMSLIDRYACTCGLASRMRHLRLLKRVPWLIGSTIAISCLVSLYAPILNDVIPGIGCVSIEPTMNSVLYILIHGILTPTVMLVLVMVTYRNVRQSRQRVVSTVIYSNFLKTITSLGVRVW